MHEHPHGRDHYFRDKVSRGQFSQFIARENLGLYGIARLLKRELDNFLSILCDMQRLSGTATDLGGDATFLSASRLGTPNAFSTAIKQQPMSAITSSPTWMSLTEDPSGFINGTRNSLG